MCIVLIYPSFVCNSITYDIGETARVDPPSEVWSGLFWSGLTLFFILKRRMDQTKRTNKSNPPACAPSQTQLVTVDDVLLMMGDSSVMGEKGEVEKLVMAIGRLFSVGDDDYPYLPYPTGYSGDINKVSTKYRF